MTIENLKNCTGCSACYSVCPKVAITMIANFEGFLYPEIDNEKCIKCGLCEKVCPVITPLKKENSTKVLPIAYAAINKNEEILMNSSSGGIFTAIAEQIIAENGIVFGAKFSDDFSVIHSYTDSVKELSNFQGSKYSQSVISDSYKKCRTFLDDGRKVLFSGTPCQIHGLKKFLCKEYENLITVDFICHGIPSPLLWSKYKAYRESLSGSNTVKTSFRVKNDGWKTYSVKFVFGNNTKYCVPFKKDPYMQIFLKDVALRNSCYDCIGRGLQRPSDITLADFWGIQNVLPKMDFDDKGTSLVICHSEDGKNLLDKISAVSNLKEVILSEAVKYNPSMLYSPKYPKKRDCFYSDLEKYSFKKIIRKYAKTPLLRKAISFLLRVIRRIVRVINYAK